MAATMRTRNRSDNYRSAWVAVALLAVFDATIGHTQVSGAPTPPEVMHFCAQHCLTLQWQQDHYTSPNGGRWDVLSFAPHAVIINRQDTSGFKSFYQGEISSQGDSLINVFSGNGLYSPGSPGKPSKGGIRFAWGDALNSIPGSDAGMTPRPPSTGIAAANGQLPLSAQKVEQTLDRAPGLIGTWRSPDGNALYFDGRHVVQVPSSDAQDLSDGSAWTLEAWVFAVGGTLPQHIAGKRGNCGQPGGFYQLAIDHNGGKGMSIESKDVATNAWTHLVIAADGASGWTAYVNGAVVKRATSPGQPLRNSGPLILGGSGTCNRFIGLVDEVSLFNRALSDAEVKARYQAANERLQIPLAITECENANCASGKIDGNIATWIFKGPFGTALWPATRTVSSLRVDQFGKDGVIIRRTNTSGSKEAPGLTAVYRGRIIEDQIDGTVTWSWTGFKTGSAQGAWHARIAKAEIQQALAKTQRTWLDSLGNAQQPLDIMSLMNKKTPYGMTPLQMLLMSAPNPRDCSNYVSACRNGDRDACSEKDELADEMKDDFYAYGDRCRQGDHSACGAEDELRHKLYYCGRL
jgi:hypothetical protein